MPPIIFIKGHTRYGALNSFTDRLATAFEALGQRVQFVDLRGSDPLGELLVALRDGVDFFLSYNGIGSEVERGGERLFDLLRVPFVSLFVDSPVHHLGRLQPRSQAMLPGFIDHSHVSLVDEILPGPHAARFMAHFACEPLGGELDGESERDIDILLPASVPSSRMLEEQLKGLLPEHRGLFDMLVEATEANEGLAALDHARACLAKLGGVDSIRGGWLMVLELLRLVDGLVRSRGREGWLKSLSKIGLQAHVYGEVVSDEPWIAEHHVQPPCSFEEILPIFRRAKVVLDPGENFPNGSHERVLSAMAAGCNVICARNAFWENNFSEEARPVMVAGDQLDGLGHVVKDVLADVEGLEARGQAGRQAIQGSHLPLARAEEILEWLSEVR